MYDKGGPSGSATPMKRGSNKVGQTFPSDGLCYPPPDKKGNQPSFGHGVKNARPQPSG